MGSLYWITRFDNIKSFATAFFVICLLLFMIFGLIYLFDDDLEKNERQKVTVKKIAKTSGITMFVSMLIITFLPSTTTAIAIYGGGKLIDYINSSEKLSKLPDKGVELIDKKVDLWMNELDKELSTCNTEEVTNGE